MNRKQLKILLAFLIVLCISIVILVLVSKNSKKSSTGPEEKAEEEYILPEKFRKINEIVVETKTDRFNFLKSFDKWTNKDDARFPVDNEKVNMLGNMLSNMKKLREIKDYAELADFKLDDPAMTVTVGNEADSYKVLFSDYTGNDNVFYVLADDSVYLTDSAVYKFAKYSLLDYCFIPENPDFTPGSVRMITVEVKGGNTIELVPGEKKASEGDAGEWYYYVSSDGEDFNDKKLCDQGDINVFFNYLTELSYNRVIEYDPSDERRDFYGIKEPAATVTVQFHGITNVTQVTDAGQRVDQMLDADFTFKFLIGNEIKESDGEYFITDTCIDSVASENLYDGNDCVFATNSYYAKFFINLTRDSLNGVASSKN